MSGVDLTRWNRAGLSRFRYIDGNAAEWLENLRQALAEKFTNWEAVEDVELPDETDSERLKRLKKQYEAKRRDLLWESTRAFARACHILTEYTDVYANERYLRTATQWDNLRRMVEMLDYHPAPPSSASTMLVLEAKKGKKGEVEKGFQVKYSPPDGSAAVVFETLEDIEVDPELNELHIAGWDKAGGKLVEISNSSDSLLLTDMPGWMAEDGMDDLSVGQVFLLEGTGTAGESAYADRIGSFSEGKGIIKLLGTSDGNNKAWASFDKAGAKLLTQPKAIRTPRLNGSNVIVFEDGHGLSVNDVIAWKKDSAWKFNKVIESDDWSVRLKSNGLPPSGENIHRMMQIDKEGAYLAAPANFRVAAKESDQSDLSDISDQPNWKTVSRSVDMNDDNLKETITQYKVLNDKNIDLVLIVPHGIGAIGVTKEKKNTEFVFAGGVGELNSGQWIACEVDGNGTLKALKIKTVKEMENSFTLTLEHYPNGSTTQYTGVIKRLYGPFKYELRSHGYNQNEKPLTEGSDPVTSISLAVAAGESLPELLIPGRRLVIEQKTDDGFENAVAAVVTKVNGNTIDFSPALDAGAGFTYANTVIRANVVAASHGEKQPERVLGNGIADQSNQEFVFKNKNVSFVADSTMDAGVRAAIDVKVDGRIWQQVSTLNDSRPTDAHYSVRMTEEGYSRICFGDGEHGRRLPGGSNNVRIAWRKGAGLSGYVKAGGLEKPVKPHRLLESVRQPMATSGSGDMEDIASLRDNAPSSLLTLERAVSITDFKHLAASQSTVSQANAFLSTAVNARHDSVEIVVVPADGSALGDDLKNKLESYLADHSMPGIKVNVSGCESVTLELEVTVRGKRKEYDPEAVKADARSALLGAFSLKKRRLGQALYRAELYEVIEAVQGVENSTCRITKVNAPDVTAAPLIIKGDDKVTIKAVKATERQVVYLASDGLAITIKYEEFTL